MLYICRPLGRGRLDGVKRTLSRHPSPCLDLDLDLEPGDARRTYQYTKYRNCDSSFFRINMLLRFRIRNLQSPLGLQSTLLTEPSAAPGVLISIDTNIYDELITQCPPAALKYVDDENEVIRVGSALELAQRLEDPARNDHSFLSHYHTFDIDHRTDILAMWTRYRERISDGGTSQRDHYFQATYPPVTKSSDQRPPLPKLCSTHAGNGTGTSTSSPQSNLTGEGNRQVRRTL